MVGTDDLPQLASASRNELKSNEQTFSESLQGGHGFNFDNCIFLGMWFHSDFYLRWLGVFFNNILTYVKQRCGCDSLSQLRINS